MQTFYNFVFMCLGFFVLIKGADFFVEGACQIARRFHVSELVIGLTIVAFGTSAPEAAVSIASAVKGSTDMALGNIVGSNIMNMLFILGVTACICPVVFSPDIIKRDLLINVVAVVALTVSGLLLSKVNFIYGVAALIGIIVYVVFLFKSSKGEEQQSVVTKQRSLPLVVLFVVFGLCAIVYGADVAVKSATVIATNLGMSERLIGLTIVAFGTSLPELVTSIIAAKHKSTGIVIGNIMGSNIFNLLFVLGATATIHSIVVTPSMLREIYCLIFVCMLFFIFGKDKELSRRDGVVFLVCYLLYMLRAVFVG